MPITKKTDEKVSQHTVKPEFQTILDTAGISGAILIFDAQKNLYYTNDAKKIEEGSLPASTFKIPNSIIALETGVVENDSTIFKWNGEPRAIKNWEQDLTLKQAFHFSCVPCYQEIARNIGTQRMRKYLDKLDFGKMSFDTTSIDIFWLEGESRISQVQEIDFLQRLYESKLPISSRTDKMMKDLMVIEENQNYKLSGKTGWSIRNGNNTGWFVGYVEKEKKTFYFATKVEPKKDFDMDLFPKIRKDVTYLALKEMGIM